MAIACLRPKARACARARAFVCENRTKIARVGLSVPRKSRARELCARESRALAEILRVARNRLRENPESRILDDTYQFDELTVRWPSMGH
jgi:hypothetical protein